MFHHRFVSPTFAVPVDCRDGFVTNDVSNCVLHQKADILLVYILNEDSSYVY